MSAVNITFPGNLAQVLTANDLRSVPSTLIPLGSLYLVNGLSGVFSYDPGSSSVDDGQDVIRPGDKGAGQAGRWLRIVNGLAAGPPGPKGEGLPDLTASGGSSLVGFKQSSVSAATRTLQETGRDHISIMDFIVDPAVRAGVLAGTDETDLSAAVSAAVATGKVVFFPAGRYHFNVRLPTGACLVGEGREYTTVRNFGDSAVFTISDEFANIRGVQITGMTIRNRNKALYTNADGIYIYGPTANGENDYFIFTDLLIFQFRYNVHMLGRTIWNRWVRCSFVEAILDNFFADATDNQAIQTFDTCRWAAAGRYGMRVNHSFEAFLLNGWTFINCNFENNLWVPIRIDGSFGVQNWTFIGCYSEENTNSIPPGTTDGVVKSGFIMINTPYAIGMKFSNCTFAPNTGHPSPDYYIYVADTCTFVVGNVELCRGGTAGVISVYWKRGLDFGLNFNVTVDMDRTAGSRSAAESMTAIGFQPGVAFSNASVGVTYSNRVGKYVINGRMVTFQAYLSLSSKGSSTGPLTITGLPLPADSTASLFQTVAASLGEVTTTKTEIHGQISPSAAAIEIQGLASGSVSYVTNTELGNFSTVRVSGSYLI